MNLSASHAALITAFGISDVAFGYLSGAYNLTYWVCQLPIGVVLDRFGVRRVGRVGHMPVERRRLLAARWRPRWAALFGARFLLGVGEAPTFPASAKAVGHWFPPHERSLPTALFDAAAKLSSVIGIPLVGFVLLKAGWRWGFAVTGGISLLYFVYFWRVYRDADEDAGLTDSGTPPHRQWRSSRRAPGDRAGIARCGACWASARCSDWRWDSAPTTTSSICC